MMAIDNKMRAKTCCFTGHRILPTSELASIQSWVKESILNLYETYGVCFFGAGGALGFDTLAAETVLELSSYIPALKLILVLPCPEQARFWSAENQNRYEAIKMRAAKVVYTASHYCGQCMYRRNRHLIDHSGWCIAYITKETGGTAYTVKYAERCGIKLLRYAGPLNYI